MSKDFDIWLMDIDQEIATLKRNAEERKRRLDNMEAETIEEESDVKRSRPTPLP